MFLSTKVISSTNNILRLSNRLTNSIRYVSGINIHKNNYDDKSKSLFTNKTVFKTKQNTNSINIKFNKATNFTTNTSYNSKPFINTNFSTKNTFSTSLAPTYYSHQSINYNSTGSIRRNYSSNSRDESDEEKVIIIKDLNDIDSIDINNPNASHQEIMLAEDLETTIIENPDLPVDFERWFEHSFIYWPMDVYEYGLSFLHTTAGLPWWATIITFCAIIKTATYPVMLIPKRTAEIRANLKRETAALTAIHQKKKALNKNKSKTEIAKLDAEHRKELSQFFAKHGASNGSMFLGFVNIPILFYSFWTIRYLSTTVPSFSSGGALWFQNLSAADPLYILPVLSAVLMLGQFEFSQRDAAANGLSGPFTNVIRVMMRGFSLVLPFIVMNFPAGILIYWVSNSAFTFLQNVYVVKFNKTILNLRKERKLKLDGDAQDLYDDKILHATRNRNKKKFSKR